MEESERPSKIRKTSHNQDAPLPAPEAITSPATSPTQQQTESAAPSIPQNGVTDSSTAAPTNTEADVPLKASSVPLPAPSAPDTDALPPADERDRAGLVSETPATASVPEIDISSTQTDTTNKSRTNTTNGTGWSGVSTAPGVPLSKNQQKKLRREEKWAAKKAERKAGRKEENKKKREKKRLERGPYDPEARKAADRNRVAPTNLPITLLLDCDFDNLMKDHERVSLAGQITRSYSENKNAKFRSHLCISSFQGKLRERFDGVLAQNYLNWKATHFFDEDFTLAVDKAKELMLGEKGGELKGVFAKYGESEEAAAKAKEEGEIIYLSSDSDVTLTELKPYSTYIIGGLVDKNREKGICHKRAVEKGFKTARLPIGDYLNMASRKVLATNHVVEIMLRWLELGDWGEAFMKVIPMRKGATLKGDNSVEGEENDYAEEEEFDEDEEEGGADSTKHNDAAQAGADAEIGPADKQMDVVVEDAKEDGATQEATA